MTIIKGKFLKRKCITITNFIAIEKKQNITSKIILNKINLFKKVIYLVKLEKKKKVSQVIFFTIFLISASLQQSNTPYLHPAPIPTNLICLN